MEAGGLFPNPPFPHLLSPHPFFPHPLFPRQNSTATPCLPTPIEIPFAGPRR